VNSHIKVVSQIKIICVSFSFTAQAQHYKLTMRGDREHTFMYAHVDTQKSPTET